MTGEDLRQTLNRTVVKISDSGFKELMQTLDPGGTGRVRVGTLVQRARREPGRKRPSCRTPRRRSSWPGIRSATLSPLVPDPRLCGTFEDAASGGILYKNVLAGTGLQGPPTTCPVLAPWDGLLSDCPQEEGPPRGHLADRTEPMEGQSTWTKNTATEELTHRRRNRLQPQDPARKTQFLDFGTELNGRTTARDFRKVQEEHGMPMGDGQVAELTAKVGCKKEGMSHLDVTAKLKGTKMNGPEVTPSQPPALPNSNVDSCFVTAEQCLKLLPQRLKEAFRDPYSAFFKMDTDRDGIISTRDLHRLLEHLLFNLRDEEFERLLGLLGLRVSVTLNFREFENLLENRPSRPDEAPQRLIRPKQKVTDSELACEQAHQYLVTKAKTRWSDLSKNFIETDSEGNGILRRRDMKNALYGFDVPLTPREFEKLWARYDTEGRGHITYQQLLQKLGVKYSADAHRPYTKDYFNFMGHFTKPQQMQEEMRELQQGPAAVPAGDKLKDHYQDISNALTKLDKSKEDCVSVCELQKVLQECGCALTREELTELLDSWGISWRSNPIRPLDFLRAVGSGRPPRARPEEAARVDFAAVHPEELLRSIQDVVAASGPALSAAFSTLDKEDTGFVKASDFGHVLKDFCYKLTDNQYHHFLRKLRIHLTPYINWKYFLQNFSGFLEKTAAEWAEKMPKGPPPGSPKEMANQEVLARLREAVTGRYHAIARDLENFDTMKTSTVSRDEFRAVCTRHVRALTDEQFDRLWGAMPVNAKGRLRCPEFLSRFSAQTAASPLATADSAKARRGSSVPDVSEGSRPEAPPPAQDGKAGTRPRSRTRTPASTATAPGTLPLQNCEPIENKLRKQIQGCWRQFLKECKERDTRKQGEIAASEFLALVEKFNLDISREESQQLVLKYDLKDDGRFAYCDFLQSCVLRLKAKETSLMQRLKIQSAPKTEEPGVETRSLYSALLRVQPQIMRCWRPMRRAFRACDEGGTGLVGSADFRKVLRQYGINLSEEEFFHVLEYYDKTLSSKLSYNDFLRAFLQ